jgi:hypothetical protein
MVQILHVYLKKIHQIISNVFSAEKKIMFFPTVQKRKKISREGSSNLTGDAKQRF